MKLAGMRAMVDISVTARKSTQRYQRLGAPPAGDSPCIPYAVLSSCVAPGFPISGIRTGN